MLDRVLYIFLHDEAKFKKSIFKKLFILFFQFQATFALKVLCLVMCVKHVTEMVTTTGTNRPV